MELLTPQYGPRSFGSSPLLNSDGTALITEKDKILQRWTEHFEAVLNRYFWRGEHQHHHGCFTYVESEVRKAINQLSNGKAPGSDAFLLKSTSSGSYLRSLLRNLLSFSNPSAGCSRIRSTGTERRFIAQQFCTIGRVLASLLTITAHLTSIYCWKQSLPESC